MGLKNSKEIKISNRYSIDLSKPYCLIDNENNIAFACPHRTNGFCDECWNKFIEVGLKAIKEEWGR